MIKKLILLLILILLCSCSVGEQEQSDKINIVCTIFPQYDWTRQIIGEENMDNFNLSLLIANRVDLHSYSPSVQDIARIKTSDVFIYVGGDSDGWVNDVLRDANPNMVTLNLMEILGDLIIEYEHDEEECEEDHDEHHADEHIWLSLRYAEIICAAIANMLSEIDPENGLAYRNNFDLYTAELTILDAEFQAIAANANARMLVFADRFPFSYFTGDYGLTHYAAFSGCSAETEASFATIISLANRLNHYELGVVMVTESSDQSVARTVINNTNAKNQEILVLDSMQSVTLTDIQNGATYISIMRNNLQVLENALR